MILRELLGPTELARAQLFYIYELTKVIIVAKDKNLVFIAFQELVLCLESFNNNLEFFIIYLISSLYMYYLS